jgi:hypothetical protein
LDDEIEDCDAAFKDVAFATDFFAGALVTGFALTEAFFFALALSSASCPASLACLCCSASFISSLIQKVENHSSYKHNRPEGIHALKVATG